ncbi:MAG: sensor histidine kinase [Methanothermobacter sp.]
MGLKFEMLEKGLFQSTEILSAIFNLNPDAITITRASDGKLLDCNQEFLDQIGYLREEVIGRTPLELNLYSPEDRQAYVNAIRKERDLHNYELILRCKDGTLLNILYSARIISINGEEIILNIGKDFSERKRDELHKEEVLHKKQKLTEELQTSNEELRQTQDELNRIIRKLEVSNRELEQFAYVASHDLQEPLRMVSSFTQLLERKYKDKLDENADEYIEFIVDGAQRMKMLIDDLLAFSRINTAPMEIKYTKLQNVLDDVLFDIKTTIDDNNATITSDSLPIIWCDPSQIKQLFQNLIANAIKFHDDELPRIHVSVQEYEDGWTFTVHDNGIGISLKHQEQIFDIFKRLHTREEYEGTGIGLAICKKIVERHGGKIWVESKPEKGSTFYFTIPNLINLKSGF